jgi:hypothetical protein
MRAAGTLRVDVAGPSSGTLRYEAAASATVLGGDVVFACLGGRAHDAQAGWAAAPGSWTCGVDALVAGFRTTGQPVDAWSPRLILDTGVVERTSVAADEQWRWTYEGRSSVVGGVVRAELVSDPVTGRISSARRTDPTGTTTYAFTYEASFPPIAIP